MDPTGNVVHSVIDYGNGTYYFPETGEWQLNDGTAYSGEWFDNGFDAGLPGIDDAFVTYAPNYTGVGEDFYAEYSDGSSSFVTNEFMNRVVDDPRGFRGQVTVEDECKDYPGCYRTYRKKENIPLNDEGALIPTEYEAGFEVSFGVSVLVPDDAKNKLPFLLKKAKVSLGWGELKYKNSILLEERNIYYKEIYIGDKVLATDKSSIEEPTGRYFEELAYPVWRATKRIYGIYPSEQADILIFNRWKKFGVAPTPFSGLRKIDP